MGLGPNLTLETAINPDFGQVEADPAEVNLTAFETRFPEKRPFFLEGAQLFNIGHPNFYYSRRIGARPIGPATGDYVDYPEPEHDPRRRQADRPAAVEDLARLHRRRDRRRGRASVANVGDRASSARVARRAACVPLRRPHAAGVRAVGVDRRLHRQLHAPRFRGGQSAGRSLHAQRARRRRQHAVALQRRRSTSSARRAAARSSTASEKAVERWQRSSSHYAQRPDRDYSPLDPTLTSLAGWSVQMNFDKISGRHWLWGANTKIDSENFEVNDFAQLNGADGWMTNANIRYRETQPGKVFRNYYVQLDAHDRHDVAPADADRPRPRHRQRHLAELSGRRSIQFSRDLAHDERVADPRRPADGRAGRAGPPTSTSATAPARARASAAAPTFQRPTTMARRRKRVERRRSRCARVRAGSSRCRRSTIASPSRSSTSSTLSGGRPETYDSRYVFAFIDRSTMSMEFRLGLTLQARHEPRRLCGAVRGVGALLRLRRAARARQPRAVEVRHQRHDARRSIPTAARS